MDVELEAEHDIIDSNKNSFWVARVTSAAFSDDPDVSLKVSKILASSISKGIGVDVVAFKLRAAKASTSLLDYKL